MKRTISFTLIALSVFVGSMVLFAMGENVGRSNERESRAYPTRQAPVTQAGSGPGQQTYYAPSNPPVGIESAEMAGLTSQEHCDEFQFPSLRRIWLGMKAYTLENDPSQSTTTARKNELGEEQLYIEQCMPRTVLSVMRFPGDRHGIRRQITIASYILPFSKLNFYTKADGKLLKIAPPAAAKQAIVVNGPLGDAPTWLDAVADNTIIVEMPRNRSGQPESDEPSESPQDSTLNEGDETYRPGPGGV